MLDEKKNILIFPGGSEIGLEIRRALEYQKYINIYGATSTDDHTQVMYKKIINLPYIHEEDFINRLNSAIKEYCIDYIFPAYDQVQCFLMKNKDKIAAHIISADVKTVLLCRDKMKTYEFLGDKWYIPKYYLNKDQVDSLPVFSKPRKGQGSEGVYLVKKQEDLDRAFLNRDNVICEYLSGEEYTVDCFTNENRCLMAVIPRVRNRIKNGISISAKLIKESNDFLSIAKDLNKQILFCGAWFFQVKKDAFGNLKLLEVSPRVSGTMALSRSLGVNFPLLSIYAYEKKPTVLIQNQYNVQIDRSLSNYYITDIEYEKVYIDYDDTLILNGTINYKLIALLYQIKNQNIPIVLITKHEGDIYDDLKNRHIDKGLFNQIIVLHQFEEKSNYIDAKKKSIFIDDSFSERIKVSKVINGFVFDLDMIDLLIDWRI